MGLNRRGVLAGAAATVSGIAVAGGVIAGDNGSNGGASTTGTVPFHGAHQAGITTAAQDRIAFAAFDLADTSGLRAMLTAWTAAAEQMVAGQQVTEYAPGSDADSPDDTGETLGDLTGRLTITIGYGPNLYQRLGLPAKVTALPSFSRDQLDHAVSFGDIAVQACSDDPQVALHAVREFARLGTGTVTLRWLQQGFGRTSSTSAVQVTPRNLMGFKDGTRDIRSNQTATLNAQVWQPDGSTTMVVRKIAMNLAKWDSDGLDDQQNTFGRYKASGASFGRKHEFDPPDFAAMPATAHVRLAAPEQNDGIHLLRRGYSYSDGAADGTIQAGLFFVAFMRDASQFVTIQNRLSESDDLNNYTTHVGSAVFHVPPGLAPGQDWGGQLLGHAPSKPATSLERGATAPTPVGASPLLPPASATPLDPTTKTVLAELAPFIKAQHH